MRFPFFFFLLHAKLVAFLLLLLLCPKCTLFRIFVLFRTPFSGSFLLSLSLLLFFFFWFPKCTLLRKLSCFNPLWGASYLHPFFSLLGRFIFPNVPFFGNSSRCDPFGKRHLFASELGACLCCADPNVPFSDLYYFCSLFWRSYSFFPF